MSAGRAPVTKHCAVCGCPYAAVTAAVTCGRECAKLLYRIRNARPVTDHRSVVTGGNVEAAEVVNPAALAAAGARLVDSRGQIWAPIDPAWWDGKVNLGVEHDRHNDDNRGGAGAGDHH